MPCAAAAACSASIRGKSYVGPPAGAVRLRRRRRRAGAPTARSRGCAWSRRSTAWSSAESRSIQRWSTKTASSCERELHARAAWALAGRARRRVRASRVGGRRGGIGASTTFVGNRRVGLNPASGLRLRAVFAVYAAHINADDPLSGLVVGEQPEPDVPAAGRPSTVRAASLNHHDLWSLRGVGLRADALPMILGCDAAGVDEDGNEVVVHSVVSDRLARRRDAGPAALDPVRAPRGHVRRARRGAAAQPRAQAARAVVRGGGVPADGVADRVPDAVHARGAWCRA